jgi:hypothetical protein
MDKNLPISRRLTAGACQLPATHSLDALNQTHKKMQEVTSDFHRRRKTSSRQVPSIACSPVFFETGGLKEGRFGRSE